MRLLYAAIGIAGVCCACSNDIMPPADGPPDQTSPITATPSDAIGKVGFYANQPAVAAPMFEWSAAKLWSNASGQRIGPDATSGILTGRFWRYPSSLSSSSDAGAMQSPAGVVKYTWPAGLQPGTSAGIGWQAWGDDGQTAHNHYYESFTFKIPDSRFEVHGPSGGMKFFGWWGVGQRGAANNQAAGWIAAVGGNPATAFRIEVRQQIVQTRNLTQNVDATPYLTTQAWHRVEFLFVANSIGSANGECYVWIDGHKIISYTNVVWRTSSYPSAFFVRKYDPTWGGNGGGRKTMTNTMLLDHIYASAW
jgi:hypothetical protein